MTANAASRIEEGIAERSLHVGVVGLGYVGLPLAVAFAEAGFRVTGVEIDESRVDKVNDGVSYVPDVESDAIRAEVEAGRLSATSEAGVLADVDSVHICVPTPLSKTKDPDIAHVVAATEMVSDHFHPGMLIVLESTTYPGTTEEVVLPRIAGNGVEPGEGFFLAFSPERLDPGNPVYGLRNTPKIIGGQTPRCGEVATALYETIVDTVHTVSSCRAAEMVKLLENTFRAVNIALVNEMALMCDRLDVDTWEVIDAAATKPYGFMPFYPGPGLGGHCIPVDPYYLTWKVRTLNFQARLIELAGEINAEMPQHVVQKVTDALNAEKKSVNGSRILVVGVAYKRDVDDTRESPSVDIMRMLAARGARVEFADPHVDRVGEEHGFNMALEAVEGLPEICSEYDCVIAGTDHTAVDWDGVAEASPILIDTRNVTGDTDAGNVVKL